MVRRRLAAVGLALGLLAVPARGWAQDTPVRQIGAGLSLLDDEDQRAPGPVVDFSQRLAKAGPVAIEGVGEFGLNKFLDVAAYSYVGGVRGAYALGRTRLFGQFLLGVERAIGETDLATQPGFGVDVRITRRLSIRGQIDIRTVQIEIGHFTENRYLAGVVFNLK